MDNNDGSIFDLKTIAGIIASMAAGIFGFIKWLESRKKEKAETKTSKEDWLIENAFEIVEGLRKELTRLRDVNDILEKELDRIKGINDKQGTDLSSCLARVRTLERLLRESGVEIPDA